MKKLTFPRCARLGALSLAFAMAACSAGANGDATTTAGSSANMSATPAAPEAPATRPAAPSQGLWQQMQAEIGSAACDSHAQCKTIAVGHKACGGPESYAAYSTKGTDEAKLARLAADHTAARKSENERSGMLSNCMMVQDPGATCSANRCVLQNRPGAASVQ
ncbi:hypothetical protein [Massilia cavernae]|nr:hypothetical protein [Massilia cavernae]